MSSKTGRSGALCGLNVLVTGATGKVGRLMVPVLSDRGARVSVLTRHPDTARDLWSCNSLDLRVGDLTDPATLPEVLRGIACILHLASYSPAPDEPDLYETPGHWPVTAEGTENLVRAAIGAGVKCLLYLSSVKAMGDAAAEGDTAANEDTPAVPESLYGRAKLAAERSVLAAASKGMHACVLRLPMVYGLAESGNIARMIAAVAKGRFPPWPRIENRRCAVHARDAIDASLLAVTCPQAAGRVYLVTDGGSYSTRWLYEQICLALGREVPRWGVPYWMLASAATIGTFLEKLLGRRMPLDREGFRKLTGNAWYSAEKIRRELGFVPKHHLCEEIPGMVREYLARSAARAGPGLRGGL